MAGIIKKKKYIKNKTLGSYVKKPLDSHFWKSLMNVKDSFLELGSFKIKDGSGWEINPLRINFLHCLILYGERMILLHKCSVQLHLIFLLDEI